jgi:putative ABC transport system permease protein
MRTTIREIQYALRRLRGSPAFTIAATLTLAIAIGATASVFGVVDGVLLKAFPYRDPDRVMTIWEGNPGLHVPKFTVSPADYLDFRAQTHAFATVAASENADAVVTGEHESERVWRLIVTPSYFPTLGITPALGRTLASDSGGDAEVVVGYGYWQRRFGGAPTALGQTLTLDDKPYTVVGVMPAGLPGDAELWTRLSLDGAEQIDRESHYLSVYGRLKPGMTPEAGRQDLETIAQRLAQTFPKSNTNWSVVTVPLLDQLVGAVRPALVTLLAAAGCVLLIGAANLANLFLVRCLARERELAVRTALGATRGRLVRELLAEAMTLGVGAGAIGACLAVGGVRILRALAPPSLPRLSEIGVDGRVVVFCALTSIATVLLFGVVPAWQASRGKLADVLKDGGRGTGSAQHHRLQDGLVVLQVAVALVLLTGAGLLVESFDHFRRMDPGFRPEGVLTAQIALPAQRYATPEGQAAFVSAVVQKLAAQPGVSAASASSDVPGIGGGSLKVRFAIVGDPSTDPSRTPVGLPMWASPDYFHTMGIKLLHGRGLLSTDDSRAVKVAVVDELLARRFLGGRDAVGQRLALVDQSDTVVIVGVVASVKQRGLDADDWPEIYMSIAQFSHVVADVEVRTSGDPLAQTTALRQAVADLDRTVPVSGVQSMSERMAQSVGTTRFSTFLASLFAAVALVLGVVGIYSVLAYIVSQRRREIAVRIALGASRTQVMGGVLRRALALTGVGIVLGTGMAWVLTRGLASLFIGVSPHDPGIFVAAAVVFALVALAAAAIPAFRTTRINPVVALTST